ncbi:hypothetical protein SNOG_10537 [Parastagonospora nodorum SN15]|uniref:Uncharacterized protein n=1 Tax=Phaeosphaeria nodorum (strain SN15 / ATCC MYA-4574 / FGSC 10173) TaxID=321614 RepID=Q0UCH7_PHANO|nr:hypothetical protein SNOG_10537 [Parastagonospora nodorum SN15]EAT81931.1 hypothetical protein SNOG_10537 [Parastagonospora nodorum SN15]
MKHFLALFFLAGLAVAEAQFSRPPKDRRDAEPQIATKPPQGRSCGLKSFLNKG